MSTRRLSKLDDIEILYHEAKNQSVTTSAGIVYIDDEKYYRDA